MFDLFAQPWPWYVSGPLIGLLVPLLLLVGGKAFGISSNLRHLCAAVPLRRRPAFLDYDWRASGFWNLAFALGVVAGGALAAMLLPGPETLSISAATAADLRALGVSDLRGFVPATLFSFGALATVPGFVAVVVGGFLVGFGARYAGGCTSGHAISGLAALQVPSLVAVLGFFAGGLFITYVVLPLLL